MPVILQEELVDVITWTNRALLQIDRKGVDLAKQEACKRITADRTFRARDESSCFVRSSGGEREGAGGGSAVRQRSVHSGAGRRPLSTSARPW